MGIRKSTNASKTWSPEVDSLGKIKLQGAVVAPGLTKTQKHPLSKGTIGYKRISGKINDANVSSWQSQPITMSAGQAEGWNVLLALDAPFTGIQVVLPQTTDAEGVNTVANVYAQAGTGYINGAGWTANNFQTNIPGVGVTKNDGTKVIGSKYAPVVTPWIPCQSMTPVNGKYLVNVFVQFVDSQIGKLRSLVDYGAAMSAPWTNYKAKPDGNIIACRKYIGNPGFPNTWFGDTAQFPILGVNAAYSKTVVNVARWGDSKDEGSGASLNVRDGYVTAALERMMVKYPDVVFSDMDCACPSADFLMFYNAALAQLNSGVNVPDILILPIWTINGFPTDTAANARGLFASYGNLVNQVLRVARGKGIRVILTNFAPNTTAFKNLSNTDVARIEWNDAWASMVDIDISSLCSGTVSSGQVQPLAGTMSDGGHYSDSFMAKLSKLLDDFLEPSVS